MRLEAFGDATLASPRELPSSLVERARHLAALARAIEAVSPHADVVVGGRSVLVIGGPVAEALGSTELEGAPQIETAPERHELEVVYDGEDLAATAAASGLSPEALISAHSAPTYVALLTGFMPGFAYLGGLDPRLVRPRLAQPRARVPAGSVAIAGPLAGVYPFSSPGGWRLLGRAVSPRLFDPSRPRPQRIQVLDAVRFIPARGAPEPPPPEVAAALSPSHALEVERASCLATLQDHGRLGLRGRGLPSSGPIDRETFDAANAAVGNPPGSACVEVLVGRLSLVARREVHVSVDGAPEQRLRAGERVVIDPGAKLSAYLAARGGFEAPAVLGSRSTLLLARLGGHDGRALRRGDALEVGDPELSGRATLGLTPAPVPPVATLELLAAPADARLPRTALSALCVGTFRVSDQLDRVGVRFAGSQVPRAGGDLALPDPTLPGALQITTDGTPIALGPDCAVTGGYPVAGVLSAGSRALLGRLRPGHPVTFRVA
jgi:KipI family sensor histidine kinase inhibitor